MRPLINSHRASFTCAGMVLLLIIMVAVTTVGVRGISTATTLNVPTPGNADIATAVYGSPDNEDLDTLRAFRDTILLTNPAGEFIVGTYYTTSPPIAEVLSQDDILRTAARLFLFTPLVYFSALCLNITAFAVFVVLVLFMVLILRRHVNLLLKGIGCSAVTIAAFTVAVFTLGAIGYELPLCATIAAYLLPVIIPTAVAVSVLEWIKTGPLPDSENIPYSF